MNDKLVYLDQNLFSNHIICIFVHRKQLCRKSTAYLFYVKFIITGRNEVVAKVMFLHVSVILYTGGLRRTPPRTRETPPPGTRQTTPDQGEPPPRENPPWDQGEPPWQGEPPPSRENPPARTKENPPPGRRLQHTVNERPVCILLECILVV